MESEPVKQRDKRERFLKIAERRTRAVLKRLQVLGNCSNRHAYEFSDEDVQKIFDTIERQVALQRAKFEQRKDVDFKLR